MKFNQEPGLTHLDHTGFYSFYIENAPKPVIEILSTPTKTVNLGTASFNSFIFVREGECSIRYNHYPEVIAKKGEFFFLPYRSSFRGKLSENGSVIVILLKSDV